MTQKLLLVDFENVQQVDLTCLGEDFHITIFVGSSQKSVPIDLVESAQRLGDRVSGNGSRVMAAMPLISTSLAISDE